MESQPLEPLKVNQLLTEHLTDYYTYVKFLGNGSYGFVDLYISKVDNKQYVIKKIITSDMTSEEEEYVKQEANLLMKLKQFKHPNIM